MAEEAKTNDALKDDALLGKEKEGEEKVKEGEEKDKEKGEGKDQKLDSAIGRITGMQSKVDGFDSRFSNLEEQIQGISTLLSNPPLEQQKVEPDFTQDPDYMPTTMAELEGWASKRDAVRVKADRDYGNTYETQIDGLAKGEESKEVHDAIIKEMMDNFNVRHSNDGLMDADLNYSKASRSYYKKQLATKGKPNPLTGPDKDKPPLGGGLEGEEMKEKEIPMPKLDAHAQAFIRDVGIKEESVKKALTGEAPISLTRGAK